MDFEFIIHFTNLVFVSHYGNTIRKTGDGEFKQSFSRVSVGRVDNTSLLTVYGMILTSVFRMTLK